MEQIDRFKRERFLPLGNDDIFEKPYFYGLGSKYFEPKLGEWIATVNFVLTYRPDQISKLKKFTVRPNAKNTTIN